jgi:hypothetical protein
MKGRKERGRRINKEGGGRKKKKKKEERRKKKEEEEERRKTRRRKRRRRSEKEGDPYVLFIHILYSISICKILHWVLQRTKENRLEYFT